MKKIIIITFAFCLSNLLLPSPAFAQVQPLPTSAADPKPGLGGVVELSALETIFNNVLAIATSLAGLAVFIMLISGGFNYLTSGGDPKKTESAKNTITYAVVGLALLVIAWLILRFISAFTGNPDLLKFTIPKGP